MRGRQCGGTAGRVTPRVGDEALDVDVSTGPGVRRGGGGRGERGVRQHPHGPGRGGRLGRDTARGPGSSALGREHDDTGDDRAGGHGRGDPAEPEPPARPARTDGAGRRTVTGGQGGPQDGVPEVLTALRRQVGHRRRGQQLGELGTQELVRVGVRRSGGEGVHAWFSWVGRGARAGRTVA